MLIFHVFNVSGVFRRILIYACKFDRKRVLRGPNVFPKGGPKITYFMTPSPIKLEGDMCPDLESLFIEFPENSGSEAVPLFLTSCAPVLSGSEAAWRN